MSDSAPSWSFARFTSRWKQLPWIGLACRAGIAMLTAIFVTISIAWTQALAWKLLPQTFNTEYGRAIVSHDGSEHHGSPCCPEHRSMLELTVVRFTNVIADIRAFELLCMPKAANRYRVPNSLRRISLATAHVGRAHLDDAGTRIAYAPHGYIREHRLVDRFIISNHYSMPVLQASVESILLQPDSSANQIAVGWPMRAFWGGVEYETDSPIKSLRESTGSSGWTMTFRSGLTISNRSAPANPQNLLARPTIVATRGLWILNINRHDPDYDDPILSARAIPNIPIWPGLIVNLVFWFVVAFLLTSLCFTARAVWRIGKGRCRHCGYPIPETTSEAKCSECGKEVPTM